MWGTSGAIGFTGKPKAQRPFPRDENESRTLVIAGLSARTSGFG
jgi:hypothetical protein